MTITQTVEIPADRRITVPHEIQTGSVIITFKSDHGIKHSGMPKDKEIPAGGKIRLSESMKNELLQDETLLSLTGILHTDMSVEQIREERLTKHLK